VVKDPSVDFVKRFVGQVDLKTEEGQGYGGKKNTESMHGQASCVAP